MFDIKKLFLSSLLSGSITYAADDSARYKENTPPKHQAQTMFMTVEIGNKTFVAPMSYNKHGQPVFREMQECSSDDKNIIAGLVPTCTASIQQLSITDPTAISLDFLFEHTDLTAETVINQLTQIIQGTEHTFLGKIGYQESLWTALNTYLNRTVTLLNNKSTSQQIDNILGLIALGYYLYQEHHPHHLQLKKYFNTAIENNNSISGKKKTIKDHVQR